MKEGELRRRVAVVEQAVAHTATALAHVALLEQLQRSALTDGLTGVVPDEQLAGVVTEATDMQQLADQLGQLALDQNSRDNVSCVTIEVVEGS